MVTALFLLVLTTFQRPPKVGELVQLQSLDKVGKRVVVAWPCGGRWGSSILSPDQLEARTRGQIQPGEWMVMLASGKFRKTDSPPEGLARHDENLQRDTASVT